MIYFLVFKFKFTFFLLRFLFLSALYYRFMFSHSKIHQNQFGMFVVLLCCCCSCYVFDIFCFICLVDCPLYWCLFIFFMIIYFRGCFFLSLSQFSQFKGFVDILWKWSQVPFDLCGSFRITEIRWQKLTFHFL